MVSYSLEGKVALVTGAAYGIGFAMAEALAQAGAKIAFNCRSEEHLQKALEEYRAKGIEAKGYICDVRDSRRPCIQWFLCHNRCFIDRHCFRW